jgi:iron complex outermembrane receptor protein
VKREQTLLFNGNGSLCSAHRLLVALASLLAVPSALAFEGEDEEALLMFYGDEETISIATGASEPLSKAPAVASVVTSEDIKKIGARDLDEALETVPGLHVARNHAGYNPIYTIRGISSQFNPQVLVLINGIPITNVFQGDRNLAWGGMPVEAIERIEVIRGPGSAVYGADAFAGVIDIITKSGQDISGTEIGGRIGSFDTTEAWGLFSGDLGGWDVGFTMEYRDTNGHNEKIDIDAQTQLDEAFGTSASHARGPVNLASRLFETRFDAARGNWRFRAGLQHRRNVENGAGVSQALDPHNREGSERWNADLTYRDVDMLENWDVTVQASYLDTSQTVRQDLRLFPPGAFGQDESGEDLFPEGVIGNPEVWERHYRINASGLYSGIARHRLRIGAGYRLADVYKTKEEKNFSLDDTGLPIPLGRKVDVTDTSLEFLGERDRKNAFAFVQDVWSFANDWALTAGVRVDHYTDVGTTTNPRLALVWSTTHNLTTKLLYGEAFRAPSFAELHTKNNPVVVGNSNLDPEKIRTAELAFDWRPGSQVQLGLNMFYYKWEDIIRFVPDPELEINKAENTGKQTGHGLELEGTWQATRNLRLRGNYAYQKSEDEKTGQDAGDTPQHQIYLRSDWSFLPDWHLNTQANFVLDRDRAPDDSRTHLDDYGIVDLTLRREIRPLNLEAAISVRNLFDKNAAEPSPNGDPSAPIPNDLPLAGRSFFGELRFQF